MSRPLRLALIPLDERPVNTALPVRLGRVANCEVLLPPREMLGNKKEVGAYEGLGDWLSSVAPTVDGLIVSVETLAFGGLIASRTTHLPLEKALDHLSVLRKIRADHPSLPIYAFTLVMRIPAYDSDDEEPTYWATYGRRIHQYSQLVDKVARHNQEEDRKAMEALEAEIPADVLQDWRWRRERNHQLNLQVLEYVADGIVDFALITQDDSAEYGVSAAEQRAIRNRVAELGIEERAVLYPGADEVAMILLARHVNAHVGKRPRVYPRYSSTKGPFIIPRYEDRPLAESIKGQIYAAGGVLVDSPQEADFMLFLNTPGESQDEAPNQDKATSVDTPGRNLLDFTESILHYTSQGIPAAVADVAYANGGDTQFVSLLLRRVGLKRLAAYAGWNTAGNTLGTVVAHASLYNAVGRYATEAAVKRAAQAHLEFLLSRFVEDWGYQAIVRTRLNRSGLQERGIPNPWQLGDQWPEAQRIVEEELTRFAQETFNDVQALELTWYGQPLGIVPKGFVMENVHLPWRRMFEVGFDLRLILPDK